MDELWPLLGLFRVLMGDTVPLTIASIVDELLPPLDLLRTGVLRTELVGEACFLPVASSLFFFGVVGIFCLRKCCPTLVWFIEMYNGFTLNVIEVGVIKQVERSWIGGKGNGSRTAASRIFVGVNSTM